MLCKYTSDDHKCKNHSCFVRTAKLRDTTVWVLGPLVHGPCSLLSSSGQSVLWPQIIFFQGIQLLNSTCLEIIRTFSVKCSMFHYFCFCISDSVVEQKKMFFINFPRFNCIYMLLWGLQYYSTKSTVRFILAIMKNTQFSLFIKEYMYIYYFVYQRIQDPPQWS